VIRARLGEIELADLLRTLERYRYRVMESAKRMLEHNRVQGVLLEGADLPDRVRQLRALPNGRFLPIWLISEQPPRGLWVKSARVGHIAKPFGEEDLLEAISVVKRPI